MPKIREYPEASQANSNDALILDTEEGTKYIRASKLLPASSSTVDRMTASGSIAHFEDGADNVPMKDVRVAIEPVQEGSGDPSPDNVRPITGWTSAKVTKCGKNIWDEEYELGYLDSLGQESSSKTAIRSVNYIPCKPNTTYYFKFGTSTNAVLFALWYDVNKTFILRVGVGNRAITTPSNAYYMKICTNVDYGGTYANDISINYPSTDHDYHEGHVQTVEIPLGQTVYGGTLDVTSGVLTVLSVYLNMTNIQEWNLETNTGRIYTLRTDLAPWPKTETPSQDLLCNRFKTVPFSAVYQGTENGVAISTRNALQFRIKGLTDNSESTMQNVYDYFAEHETHVVAKLATPITYQLTPQEITSLLGENNLWADTGDSEVQYRADTKMYIDRKVAELQALIIENEGN